MSLQLKDAMGVKMWNLEPWSSILTRVAPNTAEQIRRRHSQGKENSSETGLNQKIHISYCPQPEPIPVTSLPQLGCVHVLQPPAPSVHPRTDHPPNGDFYSEFAPALTSQHGQQGRAETLNSVFE